MPTFHGRGGREEGRNGKAEEQKGGEGRRRRKGSLVPPLL